MQTYLVGGAVRDELLRCASQDNDWVVIGQTPQSMEAAGFKCIGRSFPVFLHPETKEEYALARVECAKGRKHTDFFLNFSPFVTLEEDLKRRDFTINAIAKDKKGHYIDPFGGIKDLVGKKFRHISHAFAEDPLRILRLARLATQPWANNFTIAEETLTIAKQMNSQECLRHLSSERIWMEFEKSLKNDRFFRFFEVLHQTESLKSIIAPARFWIKKGQILPIIKRGWALQKRPEMRYAQIGFWCSSTSKIVKNTEIMTLQSFQCLQKRIGAPKYFCTLGAWLFSLPNYSLSFLMNADVEFWYPSLIQWGCFKRLQHLNNLLSLIFWRAQILNLVDKKSAPSLYLHLQKIKKLFLFVEQILLTPEEILSCEPKKRSEKLAHKRIETWNNLFTQI